MRADDSPWKFKNLEWSRRYSQSSSLLNLLYIMLTENIHFASFMKNLSGDVPDYAKLTPVPSRHIEPWDPEPTFPE